MRSLHGGVDYDMALFAIGRMTMMRMMGRYGTNRRFGTPSYTINVPARAIRHRLLVFCVVDNARRVGSAHQSLLLLLPS